VNDCSSSGDPCLPGTVCNDGTDTCDPKSHTLSLHDALPIWQERRSIAATGSTARWMHATKSTTSV
jgi:hypothetical protein